MHEPRSPAKLFAGLTRPAVRQRLALFLNVARTPRVVRWLTLPTRSACGVNWIREVSPCLRSKAMSFEGEEE
jgi:hypothetical protein